MPVSTTLTRASRSPILAAAAVLATLLWACAPDSEPTELVEKTPAAGSGQPIQPGTAKLVLLVVVDQMRGDYLDRFAPLFEHGFRRLREDGQFFTNAHQDHSSTSTSPGHATIATGRYPAAHGIVSNSWFDRSIGDDVYSVEDQDFYRSPHRLLQPTLGDLMKQAWPTAKVFAIGGKDRSAILTGGKKPDGAFWYHTRTGGFRSSEYYLGAGDLPDWLESFNQESRLDRLFGETWTATRTLEEIEAAGLSGIEPLDRGLFSRGFPYSFGGAATSPGPSFYSAIYSTPFVDQHLGQLAATLIEAENLGQDDAPDLLAVNFSATDAVGHGFGPDSPELVDTLLRLDDTIGRLLDHVDLHIGLENTVVVLTSDHGVGQVPEVAARRGVDAARAGTDTVLCVQHVGLQLSQRFGLEGNWMPESLYFDRQVLSVAGVSLDEMRDAFAEAIAACPRIDRVIHPDELEGAAGDPLLALFQRSYHPARSPDLMVHRTPNTLSTSTTASHGTANRYDTWVPMLFRIPEFPPQRINTSASVTDIAPTVAALLSLPGLEADGINRLTQLEGGPARWYDVDN